MDLFERMRGLFEAGGWVMWPLLVLSVVSLMLTTERTLFWLGLHGPGRGRKLDRLLAELREGGPGAVARRDGSLYGRFADGLGSGPATESRAHELAELARPSIDRFSVIMSTIVTASPMLGILGTVTGIIRSFSLIGEAASVGDPALVAAGIGEALFTTAFGLIVALVTLFPHAVFRAHAERCLTRLELIAAVALERASEEQSSGE